MKAENVYCHQEQDAQRVSPRMLMENPHRCLFPQPCDSRFHVPLTTSHYIIAGQHEAPLPNVGALGMTAVRMLRAPLRGWQAARRRRVLWAAVRNRPGGTRLLHM